MRTNAARFLLVAMAASLYCSYLQNSSGRMKTPDKIVNLKILQGREYICVNLEAHDRPWIHIKGFYQKIQLFLPIIGKTEIKISLNNDNGIHSTLKSAQLC